MGDGAVEHVVEHVRHPIVKSEILLDCARGVKGIFGCRHSAMFVRVGLWVEEGKRRGAAGRRNSSMFLTY